jgi:hypothetical protein
MVLADVRVPVGQVHITQEVILVMAKEINVNNDKDVLAKTRGMQRLGKAVQISQAIRLAQIGLNIHYNLAG